MKLRFCLGIGVLLLGGCDINAKHADLHDFGLLPVDTGLSRTYTPNIDLDAPKWIWDNRIRYRLLYKDATKVNFYTLDRWIATPPELFKQELISRGRFLHRHLAIKFLNFEQQFDEAQKAKVVMRFSVTVFASEAKPLASKEFFYQRYSPTADAKGAVNAFSMLVKQAITEIDYWLSNVQGNGS